MSVRFVPASIREGVRRIVEGEHVAFALGLPRERDEVRRIVGSLVDLARVPVRRRPLFLSYGEPKVGYRFSALVVASNADGDWVRDLLLGLKVGGAIYRLEGGELTRLCSCHQGVVDPKDEDLCARCGWELRALPRSVVIHR